MFAAAKTLQTFTEAVVPAFQRAGLTEFAQLHGAPAAREDDRAIFAAIADQRVPVLIHRPDEILELGLDLARLRGPIFHLGDLVTWPGLDVTVVPHPFLSLERPPHASKPIVGAFTAWGEMRKLEHFEQLVAHLDPARFEFRVGGPGSGSDVAPFVPHFNVQLYHLHGRKRFGESSGSLHRGVTVPVIFEANGAERLEGLTCVKVPADDSLTQIDFAHAAREIERMDLNTALRVNEVQAKANTPEVFARKIAEALTSRSTRCSYGP